MASFPQITYGRVAMYPLTRSRTFKTEVQQFLGDAEVRWVSQLPVTAFSIVFTDVDSESLSIIRSFWTSQSGASTSFFDFTLNGTTHNRLVFDSDSFSATQGKPNRWTVTIPVRQTRV
jgi:hypothetical protein